MVEDYLKKKWGVENILDSSTLSNHGTGTPHHSTAKFGTGINFDGLTYGKSISSRISTLPGSGVSLAVWVYPESEDFFIFNSDGLPVPASISLQKQRPLLTMLGLDQTSLPGTEINEFWASGYLPLNEWSHVVLSYDLSNKRSSIFYKWKIGCIFLFCW